ncbi:hypothetical protein RQP54_18525 [Curvibacter sp. APW13]|uniref:hypothetical protein n=1 Tax=Curvibacter sp. APW13 TaxID=3077236 RepID=UPI0028DEDBDF|nr:hypothetical protein [Curvibacter sp. APW13]MDT8992876.1 hypothetical protein [Curvibacter sp. APW13]
MYEVALFGYAFGQHFYPFFKSGMATYLLFPLMAAAFVWRMWGAVLEQDDSTVLATIKWVAGSMAVLASLYNPATFSLAEKADLSGSQLGIKYLETKKELFGTDQGSMPWLAHKVDQYMNGWVQFSAELADRRNRFIFPGTAQAALEEFSKASSLEDPQIRSILSQWQQIVVPYLLQNASLKQKLEAEKLVAFLTYPVTSSSDVADADQIAERSRRVIQILKTETTLDLVAATRNLSAMLNDPRYRLGGTAMSVDANETAVLAPMIGAYTTNGPVAPAIAPNGYPSSAVNAYNKGYSVLSAIANDSRRQPLASYDNFGDLYEHIGLAVDVALARRQLQSAETVQVFGITCLNHGDAYCRQALVTAPTSMQATKDGIDWSNKILRATHMLGDLAAIVDATQLEFAKVKIPLYIGVAKGIVTIATPFFMIFMLWPGRFVMGLTYILGGYVLVGLWMSCYIIWTYLVSDFMFGTEALSSGKQILGWSNAIGSYGTMVDALKMGYGALGTFCFLLVFGGMDKINRSVGRQPTAIGGTIKQGIQGAATKTVTGGILKKLPGKFSPGG